MERQTQKVEKGLSKKQRRELRLLIESMVVLETIESEHFFQATLRLARELNRMGSAS